MRDKEIPLQFTFLACAEAKNKPSCSHWDRIVWCASERGNIGSAAIGQTIAENPSINYLVVGHLHFLLSGLYNIPMMKPISHWMKDLQASSLCLQWETIQSTFIPRVKYHLGEHIVDIEVADIVTYMWINYSKTSLNCVTMCVVSWGNLFCRNTVNKLNHLVCNLYATSRAVQAVTHFLNPIKNWLMQRFKTL